MTDENGEKVIALAQPPPDSPRQLQPMRRLVSAMLMVADALVKGIPISPLPLDLVRLGTSQ